jgi:hypothetical protein
MLDCDWSSDVCSSDLTEHQFLRRSGQRLLVVEVGVGALVEYPEAALVAPMIVGELWPLP